MSPKPALLFLSPTVPALGGNGLAMRMGAFLEAYARNFQVTLVILPLAGTAPPGELPAFLQAHAHRVITLPLEQVFHPLFQLINRHHSQEARRAALRAYPRPRPLFYSRRAEILARPCGSPLYGPACRPILRKDALYSRSGRG